MSTGKNGTIKGIS